MTKSGRRAEATASPGGASAVGFDDSEGTWAERRATASSASPHQAEAHLCAHRRTLPTGRLSLMRRRGFKVSGASVDIQLQ
jgi:hypothetical protein